MTGCLRRRNNSAQARFDSQARLFCAPNPSALLAPPPSPRSWGAFLRPGVAMQRMTVIERAFDLARSGKFTSITEVITTLNREGYSAAQIEGPLLRRQLTHLIKAAGSEPLVVNDLGTRLTPRRSELDGRRHQPPAFVRAPRRLRALARGFGCDTIII
jgi:hypothetical protein